MNANKAIVAFVLTFAASVLSQIQDKTQFSDLTALQWVVVFLGAIVVSGGVYLTPNKPVA